MSATPRGTSLWSESSENTFVGPLLVLAAAVLWGTSGTAQALGPQGSTPLVIAIIRVGLGGSILLGVAAARGDLRAPRRYLSPVLLIAGLTQAAFNFSYFTGLSLTGVAVGTMIAVGSVPIFSGLLGIALNRDSVGPRWYVATGIALLGIMLIFGGRDGGWVDPLGVLFSLLAGFSYSFFTFLTRRMVKILPPDALIGIAFIIATCMLLPFAASAPLEWVSLPRGITLVLYMGLISSALAYMLYGRGMRTVVVARAGTLTLAEPLTGSLLGIFLLREPMTATMVAGISLVFLAQALIVTGRGKRRGKGRASAGSDG